MNSEILSRFIAERRVEGSLLERLEELSPKHLPVLEWLIVELRPSANTMREYLRIAEEIAVRDRLPLESWFTPDGLRPICGGPDRPAKEQQRLLRTYLEERRYPAKKQLEQEAARLRGEIRAATGIDLQLPAEFEGDLIRIELSSRSPEQFAELARRLEAAAVLPQTAELFELLLGVPSRR